MAADPHNQTTSRDESDPSAETSDRLSKWLIFSFIFHGIFVIALFVSPYLPRSTRPPAPVYTVDLVGGEKIGGNRPGTELASPRVAKEPVKKMASEPPLQPVTKESVKVKEKLEKAAKAERVEKVEKAAKVEKVEKPAKAEKVEKTVIAKQAVKPEKSEKADLPEKVARVSKDPEQVPTKEKGAAINESSAEKVERTKDTGADSAPQTGSLDKVREKLIQAAVDRVKSRAQKSAAPAKGADVLSVGPGEGDGAAALGSGGRGGGSIVKGADFFVYQNKIVTTIKENWAWPGHKSNLKALVRFGIRDNGEIVGVKISEPSGDPSFDESILRALRKSSPLPAPPEPYRQDFSQVEMNFQP